MKQISKNITNVRKRPVKMEVLFLFLSSLVIYNLKRLGFVRLSILALTASSYRIIGAIFWKFLKYIDFYLNVVMYKVTNL